MKTINEHIDDLRAEFSALSASRQNTLRREARQFIARNPSCANNNGFWKGLSARHVTETR